ncbi:MAG TPA: hypothetical protein VG867_02940 [Rhizomicrobium sp.]|nr:hypothetical protein [Rhizomicrobium sp.]
MLPFKPFPEMVAGVQVQDLTWDFELPSGVTLTGTPVVTVTADNDDDPQSHVQSIAIGTAAYKDGRTGQADAAIIARVGPVDAAVYTFTVSCARSDGQTAAAFNKLQGVSP